METKKAEYLIFVSVNVWINLCMIPLWLWIFTHKSYLTLGKFCHLMIDNISHWLTGYTCYILVKKISNFFMEVSYGNTNIKKIIIHQNYICL